MSGTQYIDFRGSLHSNRLFDEKVTELVTKLKKVRIAPDLKSSGGSGRGPEFAQPKYDVQPLVVSVRERLEMVAMLEATEESTSARSLQLLKLVDSELENSRDHNMRKAMEKGRDQISKTMLCDLLSHPPMPAAFWLLSEMSGISN